MKSLIVIPARYNSSRLPGKPLVDICGKPMIWWVYQRVKPIKNVSAIVATDDERIKSVCNKYDIPVVLTSDHSTHISRIQEVSTKISADLYIVVCGDEPLIETDIISKVIPKSIPDEKYYVGALMREISEPTEVIDPGNIKVVVNSRNEGIMLSRSPIPFPYKTILYKFKKTIGIECYNKAALDFFVNAPIGSIEKIEDVTLQRFLENHITIHYTLVESKSLSVDTNNDLEKIRKIIGSTTFSSN